jgi:hypothetical protein
MTSRQAVLAKKKLIEGKVPQQFTGDAHHTSDDEQSQNKKVRNYNIQVTQEDVEYFDTYDNVSDVDSLAMRKSSARDKISTNGVRQKSNKRPRQVDASDDIQRMRNYFAMIDRHILIIE